MLLNNGKGVFTVKSNYSVGSGPNSVAVADINGDGKPDIAATDEYSNTVSILLGVGNGAFAAATDYNTASRPYAIAVADVNGDGCLDIITANPGVHNSITGTYDDSVVSVLLNIAERSRVSGLLTLEGIFGNAPAQPVTFTFRSPGFDDFAPTLGVAPRGAFAVNLPKRSGTLHIKGGKYLAANVNLDTTSGDVGGVTATLRAGDANNDNSCDTVDFGILVGAYNGDSSIPGSGYDPRADFNGDGVVDTTDFGLLVGNYNSEGAL